MNQLSKIRHESSCLRVVGAHQTDRIREEVTFDYTHADDPQALHSILAVGALYDDVTRLHDRDTSLLRFAIACAVEIGLKPTRHMQILVGNLHYGFDFLAPTPCDAQVVALCCIPTIGETITEMFHPNSLISSHNHTPEGWKIRLQETAPLLAVSSECMGYAEEITVQESCPKGYAKRTLSTIDVPPIRGEPRRFYAHAIARSDLVSANPLYQIG